MLLFTQRTQVERDGAKRLLRGLTNQFDVQACFMALSDRISIEQVGHDLAVGLQAMLAAQSQATEQARQNASYWKQRCEMNSSETGRLTQVQFDLSEQLRQTKAQISAEQKLTAQEYRRNYELTYELEREQSQRALPSALIGGPNR